MALKLAHDLYGPTPGEGPADVAPLLIAHGLLGSRRNWATLARRLGASRPVAAVDLRNHGASPWAGGMTYPEMGADLLAAAAELFERKPLLLGHSMGGKASMAAALAAPDRIAGLIVADIAPVAYDHPEHGRIVQALRGADLSAARRRGDVEPQLVEAIPDPGLRAFLLASLEFEETAEGRRGRWRIGLDGIAASLDAVTGWPAALAGARFDGPAFFLHGGASDYVAEAGRAAIRRQFPAAEIDAIPEAGHWLHADRPDAFIERVELWLEGR